MRGLKCRKTVWLISFFLIGLSVLAGCYGKLYKPTRAFPAPVPENAKITINYNAKGEFFFADQDGRVVETEPIPFAALVQKADMKDPEWLKVLGCFTLYRIEKSKNVWMCDKDFQCAEGRLEGEANSAVLSINFDGRKLFLGGARGEEITMKDLKPFASLIENADLSSKLGIEVLNTFTVYRIKGSIKIAECINNICYCTCLDTRTWRTSACVHGNCP